MEDLQADDYGSTRQQGLKLKLERPIRGVYRDGMFERGDPIWAVLVSWRMGSFGGVPSERKNVTC